MTTGTEGREMDMASRDSEGSQANAGVLNLVVLGDILTALEESTIGDGELDARLLATLLSQQPIAKVEKSPINGVWCAYVEGYNGKVRLWDRPMPFRQMSGVATSLDAALALVSVRGLDALEVMHEAMEEMGTGGWSEGRAIVPQIARYVLRVLLMAEINRATAA